ncbi:MAG: 50S ribosomal protein L11 methyltransferase [Melioribacter sp.]|nr:50S ribosomal protein L11 methyltransferase [Melioribacter sp.]
MKTFKKFIITTEPSNNDLVSGLLWQLDIDGINETDNAVAVFINSSKNISRKDIENILKDMINEKLIESFFIQEDTLEDKNWNEEYEKNVRVIEVTEKIVIKPSFKEYISKPGQIIITIDPKMSFGTGEHATTQLVLKMIEKYISGGEKVLDVGSGTAVLGISTVLIGAASALCIDNDEWCVLNGNENVKANYLSSKVEIRLAEIKQIEEKEFDLIVANINKHILLEIADEIKIKIKKNGAIILSGLLIIDEPDIVEKYTLLQFKLTEKITMDEWCALAFRPQ